MNHECFLKVVSMTGYKTAGQCIAIQWLWGGSARKRLSGLEKDDGVCCLDSGSGYEVSCLWLASNEGMHPYSSPYIMIVVSVFFSIIPV